MNLEKTFIIPDRNMSIRRSKKRGLAKAAYLWIQILQNPASPKKALSCFMV
jgi:hypothetical protein